jgi:hypothetical protein
MSSLVTVRPRQIEQLIEKGKRPMNEAYCDTRKSKSNKA